jgi:hypothetical protein
MRQTSGRLAAEVQLRRVASIPFPVTMRLKLIDGTTQDVRLPVEIWTHTDRYTASVPVRTTVSGVRLWPDPNVPDWNTANDTWGSAPAGDPLGPSTAPAAALPSAVPGPRTP